MAAELSSPLFVVSAEKLAEVSICALFLVGGLFFANLTGPGPIGGRNC
jgi:hypothetical protein